MSHFTVSENKDGSIDIKKQEKVLAEICGKVNYINAKNRKLFKIHAAKMNKDFRCVLCYPDPFCPLRTGDAIHGIAEYVKDPRYGDTLNLIKPPFVLLGEDKVTIIESMTAAMRKTGFGTMRAAKLLELLTIKTGSLPNSIKELTRLATLYNFHNNEDMGELYPYSEIIKEKQMLKLLQWWYKNYNLRRLWLLGINNTEIRNTKLDPEEIYYHCLDNPYRLYALSIEKCDNIMDRLGKTIDPAIRKCGHIARVLQEYMNKKGWTGIPSKFLISMFPDISNYINILKDVFNIKTENHTAYLEYPYDVESGVFDLIVDKIESPNLPNKLHPEEILFSRQDLTMAQKNAIIGALTENISIIKGIAGAGKTTTIKEIVYNLDRNNIKYKIVSFTGKAVARIREVIEKQEPMTMHMSITKKNKEFTHLIIDEASMVTTELFYELIKAFPHDYRITLIGDPNQLTPISWGTLFSELINSNSIPTYNLTNSHRTGLDSGILLNANNIIECSDPHYNGPPFKFEETDDFEIVDGGLDIIRELISLLQDDGISSDNITIISPYNKDLIEINKICQHVYNFGRRFVMDNVGIKWSVGDRVMMTENNYIINIMNGTEGIITDLNNNEIQVTFKSGDVQTFTIGNPNGDDNLTNDRWDNTNEKSSNKKDLYTSMLIHSYAVSVHRYQGSETNYIIFYIPKVNMSKFLNRNLLYTGITRAKKGIWMVGDYDTMVRAATTSPPYRCDNLALRIKTYFNS